MAEHVIDIVIKAVNKTKAGLTEPIGDLGDLVKAAEKVGPAFLAAGTAAAAGLAYMIKGSIDAADNLNKMSQKTGVSVEALSTLQHAAGLAGVGMDGLQKGLVKLGVAMDAAAGGNEKAANKFKALGVEVQNTDGTLRKTDDVLADVAEQFKNMPDGAAKTAAAVELFGKAGAGLIPMLNAGKDGLAAMQTEARALGLEISTGTAQAAESFNDSIEKLEGGTKGLVDQFMAGLVPALSRVADEFARARVESGGHVSALEYAGQIVGHFGLSLIALAKTAYFAAGAVGMAVISISTAVAEAARGNFAGAKTAYETFNAFVNGESAKVAQAWADAYKPTIAAIGEVRKATKDLAVENEVSAKKITGARQKAADEAKALILQINEENAKATLSKEALIEHQFQAEIAKIEALKISDQQKNELIRISAETTSARLQELWAQEAKTKDVQDKQAAAAAEEKARKEMDLATTVAAFDEQTRGLMEIGGNQARATEDARHLHRLQQIDELQQKGLGGDTATRLRMDEIAGHQQQIWKDESNAFKLFIDAQKGAESSLTNAFVAAEKTMTDSHIAGHNKMEAATKALWLTFRNEFVNSMVRAGAAMLANFIVTKVAAKFIAEAWAPAAVASATATGGISAGTGLASYMAALAAGKAATTSGIAHGGLDYVPRETTYVLDKGERVVSPKQNRDLTQFLDVAGGGSQHITINLDGRAILDHVAAASKSGELTIDARGVR